MQILCLQEIFNGPYFCPSQSTRWYEGAEPIPGPTTEIMAEYARKHEMVIVVPLYEEAMRGAYYNSAAVIDADGTYLGKYRKQHIPQTSGFWEKYFFKPGNKPEDTQQRRLIVYFEDDKLVSVGGDVVAAEDGEIQPPEQRTRTLDLSEVATPDKAK